MQKNLSLQLSDMQEGLVQAQSRILKKQIENEDDFGSSSPPKKFSAMNDCDLEFQTFKIHKSIYHDLNVTLELRNTLKDPAGSLETIRRVF